MSKRQVKDLSSLLGLAISAFTGIIIALSFDTARGNQLWELFMQVFRVISLLPGSTA